MSAAPNSQSIIAQAFTQRTNTMTGTPWQDTILAPVEVGTPPDLSLLVCNPSANREGPFDLYVHSHYLNIPGYPGGQIVPGQRREFLQRLLRDLNRIPSSSDPRRELAGIGNTLYDELFPAYLKNLYWERIRDRVRYISFISDEHWIPWQLVKPHKGGREDPFLGERFVLSRWWMGLQSQLSISNISPMNILAVSDTDPSSDFHLPHVDQERDSIFELMSSNGIEVKVTPAFVSRFYEALEGKWGEFAVLHIAGHTDYNPYYLECCEICLMDGRIAAHTVKGERTRFGNESSLVFLNTCGVARPEYGYTMTGAAGFIPAFLKAGVKAVLCSTWDVSDSKAPKFATAFYTALLEGKTIGDAFQSARLEIRDDADPSWLSYTFFGDPFGKIVKSSSKSQSQE